MDHDYDDENFDNVHDGSADSEEEDGDWWWLTLTDGWWAISSAPPSPFTESSSSGSFIGELSSRAPVLLTWMPSIDTECKLCRCQYPRAPTSSLVIYFNTDAGVHVSRKFDRQEHKLTASVFDAWVQKPAISEEHPSHIYALTLTCH